MKICIIGFSGSGKSTLAKRLASFYKCKTIHMDSINFLPNWEYRNQNSFEEIMQNYLNELDSWIIDGNYSKIATNRYEMADIVIMLDFNRFRCIKNAFKRLKKYKNTTRDDMANGCNEKIDFEFFWWLLYKGRIKKRRQRLLSIAKNHKCGYIFKNYKEINLFLKEIGCEN